MTNDKKIHTIGRRKKSIARVFLQEIDQGDSHKIRINKKEFTEYFPDKFNQFKITHLLEEHVPDKHFAINVNVYGGGITGQIDSTRLGIARAIVSYDSDLRPSLRANGLLTRDARRVERKKPGRLKARKKKQFNKR